MACFTSGKESEPLMMVYVPLALTSGRTPICSYRLGPAGVATGVFSAWSAVGKSDVAAPAITERCTNLRLVSFELLKFSMLTFASSADPNKTSQIQTESPRSTLTLPHRSFLDTIQYRR